MTIFIISGGIIGVAIGDMFANSSTLNWLSIGGEIGFQNPLTIDLSFLKLTFGIWCKINIAGIICLILFILMSRKIFKLLKI